MVITIHADALQQKKDFVYSGWTTDATFLPVEVVLFVGEAGYNLKPGMDGLNMKFRYDEMSGMTTFDLGWTRRVTPPTVKVAPPGHTQKTVFPEPIDQWPMAAS